MGAKLPSSDELAMSHIFCWTRGEAVKKLESSAIPLLASLQGGVAERFRKYREASAYREAGVVFLLDSSENHPGCVCFGGFAKFSLMTQPPLLAVVQGGE